MQMYHATCTMNYKSVDIDFILDMSDNAMLCVKLLQRNNGSVKLVCDYVIYSILKNHFVIRAVDVLMQPASHT